MKIKKNYTKIAHRNSTHHQSVTISLALGKHWDAKGGMPRLFSCDSPLKSDIEGAYCYHFCTLSAEKGQQFKHGAGLPPVRELGGTTEGGRL